MNRKHYILTILVLVLVFAISGCSNNQTPGAQAEAAEPEINLDQINAFLNESGGLGPDGIETLAVIPMLILTGQNESPFYAFVTFRYRARDYIKYQVSYLSCTCREASVNMWQTMYVELTLPESKILTM